MQNFCEISCVYRFWSTLLTDALQLFEREEVRPYLHYLKKLGVDGLNCFQRFMYS